MLQYFGCIPTNPKPRDPLYLTEEQKIQEIHRFRVSSFTPHIRQELILIFKDEAVIWRREKETPRGEIQQLIQANEAQAQKLQDVSNLNGKIVALRLALGNVGKITESTTMPTSVKKERAKQEPGEEVVMESHAKKRSNPEYVTLNGERFG